MQCSRRTVRRLAHSSCDHLRYEARSIDSLAQWRTVGVDGWTLISKSGRTTANLMAAILQTRGLLVEVLGGKVMVPDNQAEIAWRK